MLKMSKKEFSRRIKQAKIEAVKGTIGIITLYSFAFAMIYVAFSR